MISIDKVHSLINKNNWQSLTQYLDEVIATQGQNQNIQKHWLTDYREDKIHIINSLRKLYQESLTSDSQDFQLKNSQSQSVQIEECVIKLFARGLILPELTIQQDINFLTEVITHSKNCKYLYILHQQNFCEIKLIYQSHQTDLLEKVQLKLLFVASSFINNLLGYVIFDQIVNKIHQFYVESDKIMNEENLIEQSDKQLQKLVQKYTKNTIQYLSALFNEKNQTKSLQILRQKPAQRNHLLKLIDLIHSRSNQTQSKHKIKSLLDKFISKLSFSFIKIQQIPSFWVSENADRIANIYSPNQTLHYFGTILINQLPTRPQYSKISAHLFRLIHRVCYQIFSNPLPIQSLSMKENPQFFILLFERFSILVGLLNKQNQDQNQINLMINAILNKKNLFSSPFLSETLWRILIYKHDDMNFRIFCMGQYKKVLSLPTKQLEKSSIHVIKHTHKTVFKMLNDLEPNSNAQFIGFHITLTIYLISCINKINKFYFGQSMKSTKNELIFNYFFSHQTIKQMKEKLKQTLMKLNEGLKDRLQVYKMKNQQSQKNQKQQKQANQISICIYRIEEEIKFD